ncbi:MAG: hypothetical protein QOJ59_1484 [Thermomicrobiales bacterium]|jgi:hypothetical protein|nr:hypothetical protein [Thermomicrobiales bacterium]
MDTDRLMKPGKPTFFLTVMDESAFADLFLAVSRQFPGAVVRMIRGHKCRTLDDFFDEIGAALQFPYYFGENWPAFNEVITDLDWIEGDKYLLMVADADQLLADDSPADFKTLLRILDEANEAWLTPNAHIPRDRQPTPFHVLFQCRDEKAAAAFADRLTAAGAEFERV